MSENDNDHYSHDTAAMRDVADHDMTRIATDIGDARGLYLGTADGASESFRTPTPSLFSDPFAIGDSTVFAALKQKWTTASNGISTGMKTSYGRVGDAARSLHKTADNYDHAEVRNTTNVDGLSRQLRDG